MIKAILFDMNGVIIDDEHIHEKAFHDTVKGFGIDLSHENYLECCAGRIDEVGYEKIAKKHGKQLPIEKLLRKKSEVYLNLFPTHKKAYDGVVDLIKKLSQNFQLALTSSSSRVEVDLVLKEFDIAQYFEVTISADDVSRGKPDPEPYLTTVEKIDKKPSECVVVEDSASGVRSAKQAGCWCIGVTTTHEKKKLLEADIVVDSFEKISEEITKIN